MHEMSIAMEICRIAEDQVGRAALPRVRQIGVVVGARSGVEPESLRFCLETLLDQPPFRGARPALELTLDGDLRVAYLDVDDPRAEGDEPDAADAAAAHRALEAAR